MCMEWMSDCMSRVHQYEATSTSGLSSLMQRIKQFSVRFITMRIARYIVFTTNWRKTWPCYSSRSGDSHFHEWWIATFQKHNTSNRLYTDSTRWDKLHVSTWHNTCAPPQGMQFSKQYRHEWSLRFSSVYHKQTLEWCLQFILYGQPWSHTRRYI